MSNTIVEQLADFAADPGSLPPQVVEESKRILLDSLGCAVASLGERGAEIGVRYGRFLGGGSGEATILGTGTTTSQVGAAFANAELINSLDQDAVLPPGHVTPYVLPGALAAAEVGRVSGEVLLRAIAVSHEMSFRIGKATDYLRDIKDGVVTIPKVIGYSSTIFGGAAAVGVVRSQDRDTLVNALGIAGSTAPTNTQRAWMMHAPPTTIKYQLAGGLASAAVTASYLAEFGHRGDRMILDDREYGFPRFIGTQRWAPENITPGLGTDWLFPAFQSFKPYPHCRVMHALLDGLIDIVEKQDLQPEEIESIKAYGESFVQQPAWTNEVIEEPRDAQFSMVHGLAVGAHRLPPGKAWQTQELVTSDSVMELMRRSSYEPHPDYTQALQANPAARLSRVEVTARGRTWVEDREFPKGSPSPDPASYLTNEELEAKFLRNVEGVLSEEDAAEVIALVRRLESVEDVSTVVRRVRPSPPA